MAERPKFCLIVCVGLGAGVVNGWALTVNKVKTAIAVVSSCFIQALFRVGKGRGLGRFACKKGVVMVEYTVAVISRGIKLVVG